MDSPHIRPAVANHSVHFSTTGFAPADQFDAWREQLNTRFGFADVSRSATGAFFAAIETTPIGALALSHISGDAMTFDRRSSHVAFRDNDDFSAGLLLDGSAIVEQDGRTTRLESGDLVLCDSRRPYRLRFEHPFRQIVFKCDRAQLEARLPDACRRVAQKVAGQAALLSATASYVASVARQHAGREAIEAAIGQHTIEVLAFTLGAMTSLANAPQGMIARIHAYIEENLRDPALSPDSIARHHQISRRQLYRLFDEVSDSVASFIRRQRLAHCKTALADVLRTRESISQIAFGFGFSDITTFSRAFRAAFGVAPREYRRSISTGQH